MSIASSTAWCWLRTAGIALAWVGAAGCGSNTYPVEGKVVFTDGATATELAGGQVHFEPADPGVKGVARGNIGADGTFRLGTHRDGDGAVPGKHRALVLPPWPPETEETRPRPPPVIDPRFENYDTSKLEFTVGRQKNFFTIEVERPAARRKR